MLNQSNKNDSSETTIFWRMNENSRSYLEIQSNCLVINQANQAKYQKSVNFKKRTTSKTIMRLPKIRLY